MRLSDPRLADHLASSYVLGTLAPGARRRFEQVLRQRADLQLAVSRWQERLAPLAQSVPPAQPSRRVWLAIERRTRPQAQHATGARPWWRPAGWGLAGIAAGAVASMALLATAPSLLFTPDQVAMRAGEKLPQSYVGLLTDAQGNGRLLVSSLRHGRTMTMKVIGPPMAPPAQGTWLVLWAMPAEGAPFMLGSVPASGSATSHLPDTSEKLLAKVRKLAVTAEPVPNPTSPSGPAMFTGNCAKLW
jgi:anti-sigma-K factor RskA